MQDKILRTPTVTHTVGYNHTTSLVYQPPGGTGVLESLKQAASAPAIGELLGHQTELLLEASVLPGHSSPLL